MLPLLRLLTVGTALIGLAACTTKPMQKLPDSKANASKMAIDAPASDIVDTAISAGGFNTLVAAVAAADLVDTLKSNGPFTVFAPTDEAFATLPEGTLESLLKPENKEKLQAILTYMCCQAKFWRRIYQVKGSTPPPSTDKPSVSMATMAYASTTPL